jgi:hypothetical protein
LLLLCKVVAASIPALLSAAGCCCSLVFFILPSHGLHLASLMYFLVPLVLPRQWTKRENPRMTCPNGTA